LSAADLQPVRSVCRLPSPLRRTGLGGALHPVPALRPVWWLCAVRPVRRLPGTVRPAGLRAAL
jgi:hypothetical protein